MTVLRAFATLPHGQVHYRYNRGCEPSERPLLMLHASPGSSRQVVTLIESLGDTRAIIAPDTPGNGDSEPLDLPAPAIGDYASRVLQLLDALGVDSVNFYGSHTGASIAAELAIIAPERVGKLIIDGIGIFSAEEKADYLEHYALPFVPDVDGAYLLRAFQFCRDQYLFFPWYKRTRGNRRDGGLRPASDLHAWLVEVLKAAETYPLSYRAAFAWDAQGRLPKVTRPTLLMAAEDDPLRAATSLASSLVPDARFEQLPRFDAADFADRRCRAINQFLNAPAG